MLYHDHNFIGVRVLELSFLSRLFLPWTNLPLKEPVQRWYFVDVQKNAWHVAIVCYHDFIVPTTLELNMGRGEI